MKPFSMMPLAGIDNASGDDADLQVGGQARRIHVRDAVNVDISGAGRIRMRPGLRQVSALPFENLWQSPLHRDVFGTIDGRWVKVNTGTWDAEDLALIGRGPVAHLVLNGAVLAAGPAGIYRYNGQVAQRLVIDVPPAPMVEAGAGALEAGTYGVAVSWLRGDAESPVSPIATCAVGGAGALLVTLPLCLDPQVTGVRLYVTRQNGGELGRGEDYPINLSQVSLPLLPKPGAAPQFRHMEPMPSGQFLSYWRGRLVVAQGSVLRFSEAMAYHVHDPRHGFVQMPQRITFVQPVDGGLWVGQVDHVAFLEGVGPEGLSMARKTAKAPVPGSAVALDAEAAGETSGGGAATVAWLADNGFVLGTPGGQVIEPQAGRLRGISGNRATSIVVARRIVTAVT